MALIICSECGKQFSDKATACPQCGCPTELAKTQPNQAPASQSRSTPNPEPIQELQEWSEELRPPTTAKKKPTPQTPAATPAPIPEWSEAPNRGDASGARTESAADRLKKAAEVDVETESTGYIHRRAESKPLLIAAAVGLIAPVTSVVWGVRQRSWVLGATPFGLALALSFLFNSEGEVDKTRKYAIQFAAGALAYVIALDIKQRASKSPSELKATTAKEQTTQSSRSDINRTPPVLPAKTQDTDQAAASKKILSVIATAGGSVIGIALMSAVRQAYIQGNQGSIPPRSGIVNQPEVNTSNDVAKRNPERSVDCSGIANRLVGLSDSRDGLKLFNEHKSTCFNKEFKVAASWHLATEASKLLNSNPSRADAFKAKSLSAEAISLKPTDGWLYSMRGTAYTWLEDTPNACRDMRKAANLGYNDKGDKEWMRDNC